MGQTSLVLILVATGLTAGCGGTGAGAPAAVSSAPSGTLVFADAQGRLVVAEPPTGHQREFESPLGRPMSLSLSLDGRQVAFGVSRPDDIHPHVVVMELASGAMREIAPEPAQLAEFHWGGGGFFVHRTYTPEPAAFGGTNKFFVVVDGATVARPLAAGTPMTWVWTSPYAPQIAYCQCVDGGDQPCAMELIVESAAGDTTQELASGSGYEPFAFTPDGRYFLAVVSEPSATVGHLVRYDIATAASVDLGEGEIAPFGGTLTEEKYERIPGGQLISPDGQEALVHRGTRTLAVKLDGSGERVVAEDASYYRSNPVFAATGAVIYEVDIVTTAPPPADSFDVVSSLWVFQGGARRQMTPLKHAGQGAPCGIPSLSRTGHTAAWFCNDGLHLLSIDDASIVLSSPLAGQVEILDADAQDRGFVAAIEFDGGSNSFPDNKLVYLGSNGDQQALGNARVFTPADGFKQGSSFAYLP
jgi:hypothetical protein